MKKKLQAYHSGLESDKNNKNMTKVTKIPLLICSENSNIIGHWKELASTTTDRHQQEIIKSYFTIPFLTLQARAF